MSLNIEPAIGNFPAAGGKSIHNISNTTTNRLAFKVKTSSNECYRVKPVFGFIEASAAIQFIIERLAGPPKEDKIVVQYATVPAEETEPKAPFASGAQEGEVILKVKAQ
uniref:MSP domain-containing protein n=1 Tax=Rhabditophanes sp. KR3021 TaxID=114890 RepID=A0AC35THJ5_9BILA